MTDDKPAQEATVDQLQYPYSLHSRYPEAGGGLFGSPMDLIKFFAMVANGGAWSTWGCAFRTNGVARVFFVQHAGGDSKGYREFRSLVDRNAETSYSPTVPRK